MTVDAVRTGRADDRKASIANPALAVATASLLIAVFVLRPLLNRPGTNPTGALVVLFVVLLAVGAVWPLVASVPAAERSPRSLLTLPTSAAATEWWRSSAGPWTAVLVLGVATFAVGRVLGRGTPAAPFAWRVLAINSLAAVAEEAFFRRFIYSLLLPGGTAWAVAGSAVLFAVAHVSVYGFWVLPVDLAAGLVLAWQRWATGSWAVPAVTHVFANVLMLW